MTPDQEGRQGSIIFFLPDMSMSIKDTVTNTSRQKVIQRNFYTKSIPGTLSF